MVNEPEIISSVMITDEKPKKSKQGSRSAFKKFLDASKTKMLKKILDEFQKKFSSAIKAAIKGLIENYYSKFLENSSFEGISKQAIKALLGTFEDESDLIGAIKAIVNSTDVTNLESLTQSVEAIVKLEQLENFVKNFCKELFLKNQDGGDELDLKTCVDEISQELADYLTEFVVGFIKKIVSDEEDEDGGECNKTDSKKKGFKVAVKSMFAFSKTKILNKLLEEFGHKLYNALKCTLKNLLENNTNFLENSSWEGRSKNTVKIFLKTYMDESNNFKDLITAIKDVINTTNVTSEESLIGSIDAILSLNQFEDFAKHFCKKLLLVQNYDNKSKEETLNLETTIEEISEDLAQYLAEYITDFIKGHVSEEEQEDKTEKVEDSSCKTPKNGIKSTFKKMLTTKSKLLNKALEDKFNNALKDAMKKLIENNTKKFLGNFKGVSKGAVETLFTIYIKEADVKILIIGIKNVIDSVDITMLDNLLGSIDAIVALQELEDFIKNFCKELSTSNQNEEKLDLESTIEEIGDHLGDYLTDLILDLIKTKQCKKCPKNKLLDEFQEELSKITKTASKELIEKYTELLKNVKLDGLTKEEVDDCLKKFLEVDPSCVVLTKSIEEMARKSKKLISVDTLTSIMRMEELEDFVKNFCKELSTGKKTDQNGPSVEIISQELSIYFTDLILKIVSEEMKINKKTGFKGAVKNIFVSSKTTKTCDNFVENKVANQGEGREKKEKKK